MINGPLFKKEISSLWKTLFIFLAILTMYITIIIYMYTPELSDIMNGFMEAMPDLFAAIGMGNVGDGLLGFMVQYLYGFILFIFPAIFIVMITNNLVCKYVDVGSMAYLLATPNTRKKIVFTQWIVLNILLIVLVLYIFACGAITAEILFPSELNMTGFMWVNLGLWAMYFFIGNLLFCISCLLNESDKFLQIAGVILFVSYICNSIATMGSDFSFLKYFSFLTLFNPTEIINNLNDQFLPIALLFIGGIAFATVGISIFEKRDLPL